LRRRGGGFGKEMLAVAGRVGVIARGCLSPRWGWCIAIVVDPWLAPMGYSLVAAPRLGIGTATERLQDDGERSSEGGRGNGFGMLVIGNTR
jgi:hypothetical protein